MSKKVFLLILLRNAHRQYLTISTSSQCLWFTSRAVWSTTPTGWTIKAKLKMLMFCFFLDAHYQKQWASPGVKSRGKQEHKVSHRCSLSLSSSLLKRSKDIAKNCTGARTQQRTSLGLVPHMPEPEKIFKEYGFMCGPRRSSAGFWHQCNPL